MNWVHRRPNTPIGIDLDGRRIRAVQLSGSPRSWIVQASASVPREKSNVPVTPDEVAAIVRLLPKHGFTGDEVVLAVPTDRLISSILDLPPQTSGAPVERIARSELARMHQCDPGAIEMSSWALPQPARAASSTPTMVCACAYTDADVLMRLFERCGYRVVALDARSRALARACTPLLAKPDAITAIVELGWDHAHVVAMYEGLVAYDRTLGDAGMERLIETLVAKSRLDRSGAMAFLDKVSLDPQNANYAEPKRARGKPETRVEMHFDTLAEELNTPLSYLASQYPDADIHEIVLTGPCTAIDGLAEYISAGLQLDVRVVTPHDLAEVPETLKAPIDAGATVATGLAQYNPDKAASCVNLIPMPKRLAMQRRVRTRCWIAACAAYVAILGSVYLGFRLRWSRNDLQAGEMARISTDIDRYNRQRIVVKGAIIALRARIEANNSVGQQPDWSILMALVAKNLGSDVVLKYCELDLGVKSPSGSDDKPNRPKLTVLEIHGLGRSQTAVSAFVLRLERAGLFENVKLIRTARETFMASRAVAFQLACTLGAERRTPQ